MKKEYTIVDHMFEMGHVDLDPELARERYIEECLEEFYYFRSFKVKEKRWWKIFGWNVYMWSAIYVMFRIIYWVFTNL